jgi:hypothetical protein
MISATGSLQEYANSKQAGHRNGIRNSGRKLPGFAQLLFPAGKRGGWSIGHHIMSGYIDEAVVHQGIREKKVAFLQEPFSPLSLAKKVREVVDGLPVH